MTRCTKCNVTISDNTMVCPLCQCVVEAPEDARMAYPDVTLKQRRMQVVCNIVLAGVIVASAILALINLLAGSSWWCLIPIGAMAYGYLVFRMVLVSKKGYRHKVLIPIVLTVLLAILIDIETGFVRWSLNYVFPSSILLVDIIIVMLMLTNLKNWQSYIIMEIGTAVVSVVPVICWIIGMVTSPALSIIALAISVLLFVVAVILGDRTARGELKRRFHIR